MKLLSEINEAAELLVKTNNFVVENLQFLTTSANVGIEPINEAATQFLNRFATAIENGSLPDDKKERTITIFGALKALTDMSIAQAFNKEDSQALTNDDEDAVSLGSVISNFYGANNEEASKVAEIRLVQIGNHPSVKSYRQMADAAVNDATKIREFAGKIQTQIEPVMNKLLAAERNQAQATADNRAAEKKQMGMARPMQGAVPQRSTQ